MRSMPVIQLSNTTPVLGISAKSAMPGIHGMAGQVRVHARLIKRGRAVAHCSLEEVQTCRVLEVPLWMLDVAACGKVRVSKSAIASVQCLRELRQILESARRPTPNIPESQHRYWLDIGGADDSITGPAKNKPAHDVCSSAM